MKSLTSVSAGNRLLSLDVFRGMTIAFMILVNTPGSYKHAYDALLHSDWHGATPTDLVFPFFLFIVGTSMFFSLSKYNQKLDAVITKKIARRTAIIFGIGLALNYFPFYDKSLFTLRIMGVLQRIALAYGIGAFICLLVPVKHLWKTALVILVAYWAMLYLGGGEAPFSLETNFARVMDLALLGSNHVYGGFGIPFDPEGLLSTLPSIVTVIFGYLAGQLIKGTLDKNVLVKHLLVMGVMSLFLGLAWDVYFPINKPLWTSSYVMYTGGLACIVMGLFIEFIDIRGYQGWTRPFVVFGMNPMIIYVFSQVIAKAMYSVKWEQDGQTVKLYHWLFDIIFAQAFPKHLGFASLLFALLVVAICWLFGLFFYRKKIFIKV